MQQETATYETPKRLATFLQNVPRLQQTNQRVLARSVVEFWLAQFALEETEPKTKTRRPLLPSTWASHGEDETAQFEGRVRERQQQFFTSILPNQRWLQIAQGTRPLEVSDCYDLVKQYLTIPEFSLRKTGFPERHFFGSDICELSCLYESALAWQQQCLVREAWLLYGEHRKIWRETPLQVKAIHQVVNEWLVSRYDRNLASSPTTVKAFPAIQKAFAPVLLCHLALWIKELNISERIWRGFCLPGVMEECCHFLVRIALESDDSDVLKAPHLWEVAGPLVIGFGHLADETSAGVQFQVLLGKNAGSGTRTEDKSADICRRLLEWSGGLARLALFACMHRNEQKGAAKKAALLFLESLWRDYVEYKDSSKSESSASSDIGAVSQDGTLVEALLSTDYFIGIREEITHRIWRACSRTRAYRKKGQVIAYRGGFNPVHSGYLHPESLAYDGLLQMAVKFPFGAWQRSGKTLEQFVVEDARQQCEPDYQPIIKARKDATEEHIEDYVPAGSSEESAYGIAEGILFDRADVRIQGMFAPTQRRKLSRREYIKCYLGVLKENKKMPKSKRLSQQELRATVLSLRVWHWDDRQSPEQIRQAVAKSLQVTPDHLRVVLHGVRKKIGKQLLPLWHIILENHHS